VTSLHDHELLKTAMITEVTGLLTQRLARPLPGQLRRGAKRKTNSIATAPVGRRYAARMRSKVTISDVARVAQVSKATVSRTLNRPELVVPEVRDRIRKVMADLDYEPNRHARALSGIHSRTVGLLFFKDIWDLVINPFWGMAASTVYDNLLQRDLDCNLISIGHAMSFRERFRTREQYAQFFRTRNVDGFLLMGPVSADHEDYFASSDIPAVMWGRPELAESRLTHFDSDNVGGSALAVDYLVARGRRTIAMIDGDMTLASARDRHEGYTQALRRNGRESNPNLVAAGDFSRQSGAEAMRQLLDREPALDAVFAANDEMAVGAMEVLASRGIRVPVDVSIVGFDNATLPEWPGPRLTSVSPAYNEIGKELVSALSMLMDGETCASRLIAATLVLGETV